MKKIFFFFASLITLSSFSQNKNIDSLLIASEEFVYREFDNDIDPSIIFELIKRQPEIGDINKLALSNFYIAHYYYSIFDYKNSEEYYIKALDEFYEIKNWGLYINTIKDLVSIYRVNKETDKIKNILLKSIAIAQNEEVGFYILNSIHELIIYFSYDVNEPEKAIEYGKLFFDKLDYFDKQNITSSEFLYTKTVDANIAYLELGHSYLRLKEYGKAKEYLEKALVFFEKRSDSEKLSRIYNHLLKWAISTNQSKELTFNYLTELEKNINTQNDIEFKRFKIAVKETNNLTEIKKNLEETQIKNKQLSKYNIILLLSISITIISVILILFIIYKYYKIQKERNNRLAYENLILEKIDEERNNYLSIISHELKTPVFTISGLSSLLKENNYDKESITMIKETSDYLLHLIKNILLLPYLEDGNSKLNSPQKETFNIIVLIKNIIDSYNFIANQKQIKILYESDDINLSQDVIGYKQKISQIIINLLLNAIKYSPNGKEIIIKTIIDKVKNTDYIKMRFYIIDNGCGIKPEFHSKIFEYRKKINPEVEASPNDMKGIGVGLYVVSKLLKELDSEIKFESEFGKGSTFHFSLNLKLHDAIKKQTKYELISPINILIIDDNKLNILVTKKIVKNLGFNAFCCTDEDDILHIIEQNKIQLILMDINMPYRNGYQLSKMIKEQFNLIIIAHTAGNNVMKNSPKVIDAKIDDVITKPYKEEELLEKIVLFFSENFKLN